MICLIFLIGLPIIADDILECPEPEGIWVTEEWYNDTIATIQASIQQLTLLQEQVNVLTEENGTLTAEINQMEKMLDVYRQREKSQQGWYVGGNITYPLGANTIGMYKFSRWGWYAIAGYNNGFNIGTGIVVKVGGNK